MRGVLKRTEEGKLLLCGDARGHGCDRGWHTFCLKPVLAEVPDCVWFCADCTAVLTGGGRGASGKGAKQKRPPVSYDAGLEDAAIECSRTRSQTVLAQQALTEFANVFSVEKVIEMHTAYPMVSVIEMHTAYPMVSVVWRLIRLPC